MFHVTRLARELHDKIRGGSYVLFLLPSHLTTADYARRHPIAEGAVISFLSSLELLKSMISLFFGQDDFPSDGPISRWAPLGHPKLQADEAENIRTCAFAMSVGFTGLALALHREMEYRAAADARAGKQTQSQWQRTAMLRHQAHEMATRAVDDVPRTLHPLPSPPYNVYVDWAGILGWAEFCLDEADAAGGVSPARIVVFERCAHCSYPFFAISHFLYL